MSSRLPSFGVLDWPVKELRQAPRVADLVNDNPFLYRVHSKKSLSPLDPHRGFVATHYKHTPVPADLLSIVISFDEAVAKISSGTATSPLVSASFSFTWAIFEAYRRLKYKKQKDVAIAFIDARLVALHSMTALEVLNAPGQAPEDTVIRLANSRSEVLIRGQIAPRCIELSVQLNDLLRILPSFYLGDNGELIFEYEPMAWPLRHNPQILRAHEALCSAFNAALLQGRNLTGAQRVAGTMAERRKAGISLALGILNLQPDIPDPATEVGYEKFVAQASLVAFELARFPCDRADLQTTRMHLKFEHIERDIRLRLHQMAVQDAVQKLRADPRVRSGGSADDLGSEVAAAMENLNI